VLSVFTTLVLPLESTTSASPELGSTEIMVPVFGLGPTSGPVSAEVSPVRAPVILGPVVSPEIVAPPRFIVSPAFAVPPVSTT
jgi:hypothetical protein